MKSSFKMATLSLPVFTILFLNIVLIISCKSPGPAPDGSGSPGVVGPYPIAVTLRTDTSGNTTPPHYTTNIALTAGTQVTLVCVKNCTDTSGNSGGPKILFQGTLTQDIPANTEFKLKMVSQ